MLRIKWVLLCDDVVTNAKGTGDLVGVVEDYVSRSVPLGIGQMAVVLGTHISSGTDGFISVVLRFGSTREVVFRSEPPGYHVAVNSNGQPVNKIIPIFFHNIYLPQFGKYNIEVLLDNTKVHSDSFRLLQIV